MVIRDCSGSVLTSYSKKISQAFKSSEVEALAVVTALSFATKVGITEVVLEGDSMEVIQALIQPGSTLSSIGPWIDDSKVLANDFVQLQYSRIRRECNMLTHSLARYEIDIPDFLVWMENVPSQFTIVLQANLTNLS